MPLASLRSLAHVRHPILGVVHLPPLAGSPRYGGSFTAVREQALADLDGLLAGGVDGVIVENFGDAPFYPGSVPAATVAQMTALAAIIKRQMGEKPLGINVLRNDGCAALAIAHACEAQFIRVNVLCGARLCDQGIIQAIAHDLLRLRASLGAASVLIFADVAVKHSTPLGPEAPLGRQVDDLILRGGADGVIVTGGATGHAASLADVQAVAEATRALGRPVLLGSGAIEQGMAAMLPWLDAMIVGTSFKRDGRVDSAVDPRRVARFVEAIRQQTA